PPRLAEHSVTNGGRTRRVRIWRIERAGEQRLLGEHPAYGVRPHNHPRGLTQALHRVAARAAPTYYTAVCAVRRSPSFGAQVGYAPWRRRQVRSPREVAIRCRPRVSERAGVVTRRRARPG